MYSHSMDPISALAKLKKDGWTQELIAKCVGVTQVTISRISTGKQSPKFATGTRIVELAKKPKMVFPK